jgi:hypothetical protein
LLITGFQHSNGIRVMQVQIGKLHDRKVGMADGIKPFDKLNGVGRIAGGDLGHLRSRRNIGSSLACNRKILANADQTWLSSKDSGGVAEVGERLNRSDIGTFSLELSRRRSLSFFR